MTTSATNKPVVDTLPLNHHGRDRRHHSLSRSVSAIIAAMFTVRPALVLVTWRSLYQRLALAGRGLAHRWVRKSMLLLLLLQLRT